MDAAIRTSGEAFPAEADWTPLVVRLLSEVDQRRVEVAGLRRANLEWRQQAGYWRSRHADAVRRIAALEQENEQFRGENRQLAAERFGHHSEKQSGNDRSKELEDPAAAQPKRQRGRPPGQPASQRRDSSPLPAREQFLDLPEAEQSCPDCGRPLKACGSEDSEQPAIPTSSRHRSSLDEQRGRCALALVGRSITPDLT